MRQKIYLRPRVTALLENIKHFPLTIVTATAGWGKTTAVKAFFSAVHLRSVWLSLTSGDELVFWQKLCRGCSAFSAEGGAALAALSLPKSDIQTARAIDLLDGGFGGELFIVIDDYQLIAPHSLINDFIHTVVLEEPRSLHIVLISRTMPALGAAELALKGIAFIVETQTLSLTKEETESYLLSQGLRLTNRAVERIYSLSAGWISALFLIGEGIKNGLGTADTAEIDKLMEENFTASLDEEARAMLVSLSSLESFTARQAAYVVRGEKIIDILQSMAAYHAFTAVDNAGRYHFHSLLAGFLAKRRSPAIYKEACSRSASWLMKNGETEEALQYMLLAGECEQILRELNRPLHPERRFVSGARVGDFYAALDNETKCIEYPFPYLHLIFFSLISGIPEQRKLAARLLDIMEKHFKAHTAFDKAKILGECCVLRYFQRHDVGPRLEALREAKKYFGGGASELLFKNDPYTFALPALLYSIVKRRGALDKTVEYLQDRSFEAVTDGLGCGKDRLALAEAAVERCQPAEAIRHAEQALLLAKDAGQTFIAAAAAFAMIRTELYLGNATEAALWLERIRKFPEDFKTDFDSFNSDSYAELTAAAEGYLYACLAMPEKIPLPLKAAKEHGGMMKNGYGFFSLIRARAALLSGRCGDAETLCGLCMEELARESCQPGIINLQITLAAAKYGLGDHAEAAAFLEAALENAAADEIIMPFAENADCLLPILALIYSRESAPSSFLLTVMKECRHYSAAVHKVAAPRGALLSARELTALSLAARGKTQREIAAEMGVQPVTAKKHLIASYKKLGAPNRIIAIKAAEALELL